MKAALAIAALLAGCVEGIAPGELAPARRIDVVRGPVAAVLPPLTDRAGNVYVATGVPDSGGAPQPGEAFTGRARGGWSEGCATGTDANAGARGWIGAVEARGWLWTRDAVLQLDPDAGTCTPMLDQDPISDSDVTFLAVAPRVVETAGGVTALAAITTGAQPAAQLATLDLELGTIRDATALPAGDVLGAGASDTETAFLVKTGATATLVRATEHGILGQVAVADASKLTALPGEIGIGDDGSYAAVLAGNAVLVGNGAGLRVVAPDLTAASIERDDDGALWLVGTDATGARIAPITGGVLGASTPWLTARAIDAELAAGVVVIDERGGMRTAAQWTAHSALGDHSLVASHASRPYAVGARGWLVGDPAVDRGGIPYEQLAMIPIGVSFP